MDSTPLTTSMTVLAQAVRARRKALRLTQIQVSQLAGCGPDFVYDVEVGKTTLRLDKLLDLLHVLGLRLTLDEGNDFLRIASSLAPSPAPAPAPSPPAPPPPAPAKSRKPSRSKRASSKKRSAR
jgi:HTH-type transcriptional regulator/antitoxin HipB